MLNIGCRRSYSTLGPANAGLFGSSARPVIRQYRRYLKMNVHFLSILGIQKTRCKLFVQNSILRVSRLNVLDFANYKYNFTLVNMIQIPFFTQSLLM